MDGEKRSHIPRALSLSLSLTRLASIRVSFFLFFLLRSYRVDVLTDEA